MLPEALGSYYKKHVGLFGKIGCISFNGNKIITTGSGGMIITNDKNVAKKSRHLVQTAKIPHRFEYIHDQIGYNSRMSNLNASLGIAQIKSLKNFLKIKEKSIKYIRIICEILMKSNYLMKINIVKVIIGCNNHFK